MLPRAILLAPCVLLALAITGCGPSQATLEKSMRDEMKSQLGVVIASFNLTKQGDGSYAGTATAENGDVYDVTTTVPKGGKIEWKASPGQAMIKKQVWTGIEQQMAVKVKSLQLTKNAPSVFTGTAELESGAKLNVKTRLEGTQVRWEAKPANP